MVARGDTGDPGSDGKGFGASTDPEGREPQKNPFDSPPSGAAKFPRPLLLRTWSSPWTHKKKRSTPNETRKSSCQLSPRKIFVKLRSGEEIFQQK